MEPREVAVSNTTKGQSLLEFGLSLPFLALIIFGVFDLGFAVYASNTIALAARDGARVGVVQPTNTTAICQQAINTAQLLNLACGTNISVSTSNPVRTNPITVTVTYTYTPFTPFIGGIIGQGGIRLHTSSSMIVE